MKVADILQIKGSDVKTVRPDTSARKLAVRLHVEQIGAMVVSNDGRSVDGLVSERDLAYALAAHGSELPTLPVSRLMTKAIVVCSPEGQHRPCDEAHDATAHSSPAREARRQARGYHQHRRRSKTSP